MKLKLPSTKTCDPVVRSNNKRALIIHFLLSIIGLASAAALTAIASFVDIGFAAIDTGYGAIPLMVTVVGGAFIYVACGYFYLHPTKEKASLSVWWLTRMTAILAVLILVLGLLSAFISFLTGAEETFVQTAYILLIIPGAALLSTITFGTILLLGGALDLIASSGLSPNGIAVQALSILTTVLALPAFILPSTLLALGLRIRQRQDDGAVIAEGIGTSNGRLDHARSENSAESNHEWENSNCENFNWKDGVTAESCTPLDISKQ